MCNLEAIFCWNDMEVLCNEYGGYMKDDEESNVLLYDTNRDARGWMYLHQYVSCT